MIGIITFVALLGATTVVPKVTSSVSNFCDEIIELQKNKTPEQIEQDKLKEEMFYNNIGNKVKTVGKALVSKTAFAIYGVAAISVTAFTFWYNSVNPFKTPISTESNQYKTIQTYKIDNVNYLNLHLMNYIKTVNDDGTIKYSPNYNFINDSKNKKFDVIDKLPHSIVYYPKENLAVKTATDNQEFKKYIKGDK